MKWEKYLSRTDAQQPTRGRKITFLRLTSGETGVAHTTWFRESFFDGLSWSFTKSQRGRDIEEAKVDIHVTILGQDYGKRTLRIEHDPTRADSHSAPTTYLRYDNRIRTILESQADLIVGRVVRLTRSGTDYFFEIL